MSERAEKMRAKYGEDYYSRLGKKGGQRKVKKGFALLTPEQRREVASVGGKSSKRGSK